MKKLLFYVSILVLLSGCTGNEEPLRIVDLKFQNIVGTWKLTETYISPGGTTEWRPVEDGVEYTFNADATFLVTEGNCRTGTFSLEEDLLSFNCSEASQNSPMSFRFNSISSEQMEVSYIGCIEACIYRFQKQ